MTSAGIGEPGKKQTPRNWTMCGWRRVLINRHSRTNSADVISIHSGATLVASWNKLCIFFAAHTAPGTATSSTLP